MPNLSKKLKGMPEVMKLNVLTHTFLLHQLSCKVAIFGMLTLPKFATSELSCRPITCFLALLLLTSDGMVAAPALPWLRTGKTLMLNQRDWVVMTFYHLCKSIV